MKRHTWWRRRHAWEYARLGSQLLRGCTRPDCQRIEDVNPYRQPWRLRRRPTS